MAFHEWDMVGGLPRGRRRARRGGLGLPLWYIVQLLVLVTAIKLTLYFGLGGAAYGAHASALGDGTAFEQALAALLWIDPVMQGIIALVEYGLQ